MPMFQAYVSERVASSLEFPAGTVDLYWARVAVEKLQQEGLDLLFLPNGSVNLLNDRMARLQAVGLLSHIDPESLGMVQRYPIPLADLAPYISIFRSMLTVAPELFAGATKAAAIRRQPVSSMSDIAILGAVTTRLTGKTRVALAIELANNGNTETSQGRNLREYPLWPVPTYLNLLDPEDLPLKTGEFFFFPTFRVVLESSHQKYPPNSPEQSTYW